MTTWRDMRPANWARTVARLKRNAQELKEYGAEVRLPDNFEIPPDRRIANTSTAT